MADERREITIVWNEGPQAQYEITPAELGRLAADFQNWGDGGSGRGVYDVQADGRPRKLMLIFEHIRYIG